jgi:hypothetical protein
LEFHLAGGLEDGHVLGHGIPVHAKITGEVHDGQTLGVIFKDSFNSDYLLLVRDHVLDVIKERLK